MDKKRLLELAGVLTENDQNRNLFPAMKDHKIYDQQKVEELLEAAAEAMAWIGYEGAGAEDAKKRLEAAYQAVAKRKTWERD